MVFMPIRGLIERRAKCRDAKVILATVNIMDRSAI